jgi:toxin ParE1/3/4
MTYRVVFTPQANDQLLELYEWLAEIGYPTRAEDYVTSIIAFCERLGEFPETGRGRDDIRPGMRTAGFRRRVVIAYAVTSETVDILGVFYGGRDYDTMLREGE